MLASSARLDPHQEAADDEAIFERSSRGACHGTFLSKTLRRQAFASRVKILSRLSLKTENHEHHQPVTERSGGPPYGSSEALPQGLGNSRGDFRLSQHSRASTILATTSRWGERHDTDKARVRWTGDGRTRERSSAASREGRSRSLRPRRRHRLPHPHRRPAVEISDGDEPHLHPARGVGPRSCAHAAHAAWRGQATSLCSPELLWLRQFLSG